MKDEIESPCIGVCRLENEICLGCGRTIDEVVGWYDMTNTEKQLVLDRLAEQNKKLFG